MSALSIKDMSRKELLAQLDREGYTGPTSYTKARLRAILKVASHGASTFAPITGTRAGVEILGRTGARRIDTATEAKDLFRVYCITARNFSTDEAEIGTELAIDQVAAKKLLNKLCRSHHLCNDLVNNRDRVWQVINIDPEVAMGMTDDELRKAFLATQPGWNC